MDNEETARTRGQSAKADSPALQVRAITVLKIEQLEQSQMNVMQRLLAHDESQNERRRRNGKAGLFQESIMIPGGSCITKLL
jgi:hypothetical protein